MRFSKRDGCFSPAMAEAERWLELANEEDAQWALRDAKAIVADIGEKIGRKK